MHEKNKKNFVCTELESERAFTFIEVILILMIISITMPFIVYLFQHVNVQTEEDISILQFFTFIKNDALKAETVSSVNDVLYFQLNTGETAKLEQYKDLVRRRVNDSGHEIYVREIKAFKVNSLPYGTEIIVTTTKGNTYEKVIAHY